MRTPSPTRHEGRPFEVFGDASSAGALEEEAREEDRDGGGSTYTGEAVGAGMARRRREEAMDDPMMMRGGEWFTGGETEEERANREVQLQADIVLTHDRTAQAGELAEAEYLNANTYLDEAEALMQSVSRVIENELPLPYVDLQPGSNGFIMMQQLRESRENLKANMAEVRRALGRVEWEEEIAAAHERAGRTLEWASAAEEMWGRGDAQEAEIYQEEAEMEAAAVQFTVENALSRAWETETDVSPGTAGFDLLQGLQQSLQDINAMLEGITRLQRRFYWEQRRERAGRRIELNRWLEENPPPSERARRADRQGGLAPVPEMDRSDRPRLREEDRENADLQLYPEARERMQERENPAQVRRGEREGFRRGRGGGVRWIRGWRSPFFLFAIVTSCCKQASAFTPYEGPSVRADTDGWKEGRREMEWLSALRKTHTINQTYSPSKDWECPSDNMVGGRVQLMTEERESTEELSGGCLEKSDIVETLLLGGSLTMGAGGRGDREKMYRIMHAYNGNIPSPTNTAPTPAFP
uniref:Uncharacterized protein n=1 Tax=Chromera velia CCMP2878 TaxID=1169474 RepID=A0A0G4I396_9ALVE|eukprot:Cvel_10588.t1-p1 / transcript=Cvel_10588.t1 / gene=Cvel_10588 / organism=Chromera_velia_CCMP2878 / gene_product=hypothetical protein / transcript_product=hypothetical protein / location=Cvel_scaffold642:36170-37747(+) / protein_length=526 / sequence_SO=supercontig / SO=protein_coding / is_pseudo=false